jgi:hypothetical protein
MYAFSFFFSNDSYPSSDHCHRVDICFDRYVLPNSAVHAHLGIPGPAKASVKTVCDQGCW